MVKLFPSSARVSQIHVSLAPPDATQGAVSGGRKTETEEDGGADEDDVEEEEVPVSSSREEIPVKSSTLFIDGISERVGYAQIRALFAQIGRVGKVFVQRQRKIGRRFRFGFVRFLTRAHTEAALLRLNGVKVEGFHLSVTVAKFPRVRGSASRNPCSGHVVHSKNREEVGFLENGTQRTGSLHSSFS